jgi:hypothetical protein
MASKAVIDLVTYRHGRHRLISNPGFATQRRSGEMHVYSRHHAYRFTVYGGGVTYDGARAFIGRSRINAPVVRAINVLHTLLTPEREDTFACVHDCAWLLPKRDQKAPIARPRSSELAF